MTTPRYLTPEGKAEAADRAESERLLLDDALESLRTMTKEPTQHNRRMAVRTFFACIEGMAFSMRQYALVLHEAGESEFSSAELAFLREESYLLDKAGEAGIGRARVAFRRLLPFSFAMHARHIGSTYVLDRSGDGWRDFCGALEIRHRVTHPRKRSELEVTDSDVRVVVSAFNWFVLAVMEVRRLSIEPFEKQLEALKFVRAKLDEIDAALKARAVLAPAPMAADDKDPPES